MKIVEINNTKYRIIEDSDDLKQFVGHRVKIYNMQDEPSYTNKEGVITSVDDIGQLHGTWGGCALVPELDEFQIEFIDPTNSLLDALSTGKFEQLSGTWEVNDLLSALNESIADSIIISEPRYKTLTGGN